MGRGRSLSSVFVCISVGARGSVSCVSTSGQKEEVRDRD